jgi:hypothetical protein
MTQTLELMSKRAEPKANDEYWARFWKHIDTEIGSAKSAPLTQPKIFVLPPVFRSAWSYGIAATVILAVGIYIGRTLFVQELRSSSPQATRTAAMNQLDTSFAYRQAINQEVSDYLDRSRVLLQGVVNSPDEYPEPATIEHQQQLSRDLIQKAAYLKSALTEPDDEYAKQLIMDLEVVLLQLANYSADNGVPLIEMVKQGVDKKSILLKINLEEIHGLGAKAKIQKKAASGKDRKSQI